MFYLSSLERNAQELALLIRQHCYVENRLHWPKDAVLKEDSTPTCAGRAIMGFAILRTMAVNLFRANSYQSITEALDMLSGSGACKRIHSKSGPERIAISLSSCSTNHSE